MNQIANMRAEKYTEENIFGSKDPSFTGRVNRRGIFAGESGSHGHSSRAMESRPCKGKRAALGKDVGG